MADFPVKVENVVAVAMLGVDVPLEKMSSQTEKAEYEPEPFSGLVYRPGERGVAALIFSSGKIVCTGTRNVEHARETVNKVVQRIKELGVSVPAGFTIEIDNIVGSSKINAQLSLQDLAFSLENAEYDPDRFPGLVYRISDPEVSFMLFASGKIICSGAHSIGDIQRALRKLLDDLKKAGIKAEPSKG